MSLVPFGFWASSGGGSYIAGLFSGDYTFLSVAVDPSDGNYIMAGYYTVTGEDKGLIIKIEPDGSIVWQKFYGDGTRNQIVATVDNSGNIYASNRTEVVADKDQIVLLKLNSSGDILAQKLITKLASGSLDFATRIVYAADGNLYVAGHGMGGNSYGGAGDGFLFKLDTSLNFIWSRKSSTGGADLDASVRGIAIASDGNSYAGTIQFTSGTYLTDPSITRLNSSGNIQFSRGRRWENTVYGTPSRVEQSHDVGIDSSQNGYLLFDNFNVPGYDMACAMKVNSSGTVLWAIGLTNRSGVAMTMDSSGNQYYISAAEDTTLIKVNDSGTILYKRRIANSQIQHLKIDLDGKLLLVGRAYDSPIFIKINTDGSDLGTVSFASGDIIISESTVAAGSPQVAITSNPNWDSISPATTTGTQTTGNTTKTLELEGF